MKSLRLRMLAAMLGMVLGLWCAGAALVFHQVWRGEAMWDEFPPREAAQQVLARVQRSVDAGIRVERANIELPRWFLGEYQVWSHGHLVLRSAGAPTVALKSDLLEGGGRSRIGDEVWWTYALSDGTRGLQVQVGRLHPGVEHDLRMLSRTGFLLSLVVLAAWTCATWAVVRWSLRPVGALHESLSRRAPLDTRPVPSADLPGEVRPLVDAFNALLKRLEHSLEAERRFLADAAHELRTPLAALTLQAQVALKAEDANARKAALRELDAGVARSARLAEQLLDSSRLGALHEASARERVDLSMLVRVVARDVEVLVEENRQTLTLDLEPALIDGHVDALGVLIRNLLDNALRYSGGHGRIHIACHPVDDCRAVLLGIRDDGPGVPADERGRIFERFYRVRGNARRGTGIGLSLVARIAQLQGATLTVHEGLEARGLGITLRFPGARFINS
ncbi:HAMP domain-containing protein [Myxococcaceae bacterium JPH2]|nr:HAMP domain-containing protein [Myxococcaceae bacterium JPH2]